jgi:hypothetical protein
MTVRDYLTEEVTIESASIEDSRDGDRWKMMVQIPSMRSNYPTGPIWKKVEDGERIKAGDTVVCKLVRGKLKKPGAYEDADFGYYWELSEWATSDAPTVSTASRSTSNNGGGGSDQVEYRRSKELMNWIEALKITALCDPVVKNMLNTSPSEYECAISGESAAIDTDFNRIISPRFRLLAEHFYMMIVDGPPKDEPEPVYRDPRDGPEATETPVQPVPAPVASKLQRPPAKSSDAKLKELDEARTDTKGIEICSADAVVQYIASNYDERGPRDLTEAEVNQLIDAIRGGYVRDPGAVDPEPVDAAQLPF